MSHEASSPPRVDHGPGNFVAEIVQQDVESGALGRPVAVRFPPEPNGYLHLGHAKSICLNFGLAARFGGACNLRFDDTNPDTERHDYVEAIKHDVRWLGFGWGERELYASDYFERLYGYAEAMIVACKAYVDTRSVDEIRASRGDFYHAGHESPDRARSPGENLDLFRRMRAGEFADGSCVLRARGDLSSTDVKMRDPVMYRIKRAHHHRTGDAWCIYPMYDWAHGQSDFIEGITHSVCTLEFANHRPLYHWFLDQIGASASARPKQIEFARLNLSYTVLSKRWLQALVRGGHVSGWDDPRMPTLAGLRRRGVTPEAIRAFCERVGVSTRDSVVDYALFENAVREHLNATSPRVMAVLRPLRVVIENWPEDRVETLSAPLDPERPGGPRRDLPFGRVIFIDRDDFSRNPSKKWFRLAPGAEVRLRYACVIRCHRVVEDPDGNVVELRCTWDETSLGGAPADGRKVKGTLHWVSAAHSLPARVHLYDRLFDVDNPTADGDPLAHLNPSSLEVIEGALVEPFLRGSKPLDRVQFERTGYFCVDPDSKPGSLIFNRTVPLRDAWAGGSQT